MASVNKAIILGNLGRDPELRHTTQGKAVCNFGIATNESWTDQNGVKHDRTEWHNMVVWGRQAEVCVEYLKKGSSAYFEGRIQTRKFTDKAGEERESKEICVDRVQFINTGQGQRNEDVRSDVGSSDIPF